MENSNEKLELLALERTASSFYHYRDYALEEFWKPRVQKWEALSENQKEMIPWYKSFLDDIRDAVETNAVFYLCLLECSVKLWGLSENPSDWASPSTLDMSKTCSIFTQITREWCCNCSSEREIFMNQLTEFLNSEFPNNRDSIHVLVPGGGLGRLAVDLVRMGFRTEANEVSYHMLLLGQFILDGGLRKEQTALHPFIHSFSHHINRHEQLKKIYIPDIDIAEEIGGRGLMSMVTGSFVDLYGPNLNIKQSDSYSNSAYIRQVRAANRESKDVVITNFFIDTGPNVLDYLETINHVLRKGGFWINFGPFMYHFETDPGSEITVDFDGFSGQFSNRLETPLKGLELTHEDLIEISKRSFGFRVIKESSHIPSGYGTNEDDISMLGYQCSFWILQKP